MIDVANNLLIMLAIAVASIVPDLHKPEKDYVFLPDTKTTQTIETTNTKERTTNTTQETIQAPKGN